MQLGAATIGDIAQILLLQEKYLVSNLTDAQKKDGFVTTPFTVPQLEQIIGQQGLFIAKQDDRVIAYVFAGSWDYFSQWPIFNVMTERFPRIVFRDFTITTDNSFQYGPICIHEDFRGTRLLYDIFETMRVYLVQRYPLSLTFINQINGRSVRAHVDKLGWEIIDEFGYNGNMYFILGYDMKVLVSKD